MMAAAGPEWARHCLLGLLLCFSVTARAGMLTGTFLQVPAGSNVNLTALGKLDWVHWGLYTDTSMNRKACAPPLISSLTLLGDSDCGNCYLTHYQYTDNFNGYSWFDGAPWRAVTNTTTGVWVYSYPNPTDSGFQFTVAADPFLKTLHVFVGAFSAEGQLQAFLSDGSAPPFISSANATVDNQANGPGGVFTLSYAANSPGQTLTVRWQLANSRGPGGNVTLQAAALSAPGANNLPYVLLTNPGQSVSFPEPATIPVQAFCADFDGTITNVSFYVGTNKLGEDAANPYTIVWSNVNRGRYELTAFATDDKGLTSRGQPIELIVHGTRGRQNNSVSLSPPSVHLTSEGTLDWAHWGLENSTSFDFKASGLRSISNFTVLGTNTVANYFDNFTSFAWSDGNPTPTADATTSGVFITGIRNGFYLTAAATTTALRRLKLYVGGYGVQAELHAYLSDLSAPPYTDTTVSNIYGNDYVVYTIDYRAARPDQRLMVTYRSIDLFDLTYGNVTLQSATLQEGPFEPFPVRLLDPQTVDGKFIFSFLTQSNASYNLQSADSWPATNWTTRTVLSGTGTRLTVTNRLQSAPQFYRVVMPVPW